MGRIEQHVLQSHGLSKTLCTLSAQEGMILSDVWCPLVWCCMHDCSISQQQPKPSYRLLLSTQHPCQPTRIRHTHDMGAPWSKAYTWLATMTGVDHCEVVPLKAAPLCLADCSTRNIPHLQVSDSCQMRQGEEALQIPTADNGYSHNTALTSISGSEIKMLTASLALSTPLLRVPVHQRCHGHKAANTSHMRCRRTGDEP